MIVSHICPFWGEGEWDVLMNIQYKCKMQEISFSTENSEHTWRSATAAASSPESSTPAAAAGPICGRATLRHRHLDDVAAEVLAREPVDGRAGRLDILVSDSALTLVLASHLVLVHPDARLAGSLVRLRGASCGHVGTYGHRTNIRKPGHNDYLPNYEGCMH